MAITGTSGGDLFFGSATVDFAALSGFSSPNNRLWEVGGDLYWFGYIWDTGTSGVEFRMYKSTNAAVSWSEVDSGNRPDPGTSFGDAAWSWASVLDGTTIHIAVSTEAHASGMDQVVDNGYISFNTSNDTWGSFSTAWTATVGSTVHNGDCAIAVRSDGDIIIVGKGDDASVMGNDQERLAYSIYEGSSWTTEANLDWTGIGANDSTDPAIVCDQADDTSYIFTYSNGTGGGLYAWDLSSTNTLSSDTQLGSEFSIPSAAPVVWTATGQSKRVGVAVRVSNGNIDWWTTTTANFPNSWTTEEISTGGAPVEPVWRPDDDHMYFMGLYSTNDDLYVYALEDGDPANASTFEESYNELTTANNQAAHGVVMSDGVMVCVFGGSTTQDTILSRYWFSVTKEEHSADVLLLATETETHNADVLVLGNKVHYADLFIDTGVPVFLVDHDAELQIVDRLTVTHSADLQLSGFTQHNGDVLALAIETETHSADVFLLATETVTHSADVIAYDTILLTHTAYVEPRGDIVSLTQAADLLVETRVVLQLEPGVDPQVHTDHSLTFRYKVWGTSDETA